MAFSARLNGLATTFVACLAASTGLNGQAQAVELWPKAVVQRVSELYGISEIAATDRLASEAKAADLYRIVEGFRIEGYAGSWYDAQSGQLIVAINEAGDEALVRRLGASPTVVRYSLMILNKPRSGD